MDHKTREALEGSIEKWRKIVDGMGTDLGHANCPLCQMFLGEDESCTICPVKLKTGEELCRGTPYSKYASCSTTANARAELAFLKSLRLNDGDVK